MANNSKYLNYEGLAHFLEKLDERFAPIQAIIFKSTVEDLDALPALNTQKAGYMYNVKTGGITTEDFVEGAGHLIADGENVVAVELITGYTAVSTPAATDDPKALGWYERNITYNNVTSTLASDANPQALGLYEEDGAGGYQLTTDTTVVASKNYFEQVITYVISQDRIPNAGKTYYTADKVMKWDALGGLFDLEGRYLEFGGVFPQKPASRMIDGRTFLYMGENTSVFNHVDAPTGRPSEQGYYEVTFTAVSDLEPYFNPKQQGLYEETSSGSGIYALSNDIEVKSGKSYFTAVGTASTDTTVNPAKQYYTREEQYKKGGIYEYSTTAEDWVLQSSGGSDMDPITNAEIDELFI